MRILVVSDNHGRMGNFLTIYEKVKPVDMVIHLGDTEGTEDEIEEAIDCPFYAVAGNNDFYTTLPREQEIQIGKYKALLCHGHYYRVSFTNQMLAEAARQRGCTLAFYGHIHRPVIDRQEGVTLVNPGSINLPRQENRKPSYVMMDIDRQGEAHFTMCYL